MKIGRDYKQNLSFSDEKEIIEDFLKKAQHQNKSFALWKLPESATKYICIGLSKLKNKKFDIENDKGFAVSRFINTNHSYYLIPPEVTVTITNGQVNYSGTASKNTIEEFLSYDNSIAKDEDEPYVFECSQADYITIATEAVKRIKQGSLKKVVVARCKKVIDCISNPVELYNQLSEAYPSTFISLIHIPQEGTWIGASPELLMAIEKDNILKTIALAATQNVLPKQSTADVVWKEKEIEEQALVNRYIASCFQKLNLKDYEETGPRTIRTGHLMHLRTDFSVNLNAANLSTSSATDMLRLLHPTSAVCGMPKQGAIDFITNKEGFDRALYAGFLGPVNMGHETKLFVNIRCARLFNSSAILYAGAGITADSEPAREWEETESKLQALGAFLFKS